MKREVGVNTIVKKISIVTTSFSSGGAEKIAVNLANVYASQGYAVSLVSFKNGGVYRDQVSDLVNVVELGVQRSRQAYFVLFKALKAERPDYVLSVIRDANIFVGLASWICKPYRLVFREASTMNAIYGMTVLKRFIYMFLLRLAYSKADHVISNSEATGVDLVRHGITKSSKISVIGNPVLPDNFEEMRQQQVDHRWISDKDCLLLLHVGRLSKAKNQEMLVRGFSVAQEKIPQLRLIVIGIGDELDKLVSLTNALGVADKIDFIGFKSNPYPYYVAADLFVLTSSWEGFGNVLVEAMACGTPVISTDCPGGPREILQNGDFGKLVPVGDHERLGQEIVSFFTLKGSSRSRDELMARANLYSVGQISRDYLTIIFGT